MLSHLLCFTAGMIVGPGITILVIAIRGIATDAESAEIDCNAGLGAD